MPQREKLNQAAQHLNTLGAYGAAKAVETLAVNWGQLIARRKHDGETEALRGKVWRFIEPSIDEILRYAPGCSPGTIQAKIGQVTFLINENQSHVKSAFRLYLAVKESNLAGTLEQYYAAVSGWTDEIRPTAFQHPLPILPEATKLIRRSIKDSGTWVGLADPDRTKVPYCTNGQLIVPFREGQRLKKLEGVTPDTAKSGSILAQFLRDEPVKIQSYSVWSKFRDSQVFGCVWYDTPDGPKHCGIQPHYLAYLFWLRRLHHELVVLKNGRYSQAMAMVALIDTEAPINSRLVAGAMAIVLPDEPPYALRNPAN